jgi:general secretion pathway protein C
MLNSGMLTKRNLFYLNILMSAVLLFAILFLIRDVITRYFEKEASIVKEMPATAGITTGDRKLQLSDYAPVLKNNPFGFPGGEIKPLSLSMNGGVQQADIALIGTVAGPEELSYGIFKDNTGIQEVFKSGDSVFGLGTLQRVERDKVILKKAGKTIEIPMEDVKVREVKKQTATGISPAFAQRVGRGTYVVDQARLQQIISNPGQMMTDARLRPNIVNGREEGFALSEVKSGGVYQSLGLQDGDVLLRINEYDISNPERALQAFTALKGLDRVQIDLVRSGARMTMTYQIR